MRAADRHHGVINLRTCRLLGLLDRPLDRSDSFVEVHDHALAAAARFGDAVYAIAQTGLSRFGDEGEGLGAADVERDQKILLLFHYFFPLPFTAGFGFFGAILIIFGLGASLDCACESGLTITWPSNRRSTDSSFVNCCRHSAACAR